MMNDTVFYPYFITVEGGEGTGKSTLISRLENALQKKGYQVLTTREPGGTALGEDVRKLLIGDKRIFPKAELFLFLAQRNQHIAEVIKPALEAKKVVICDRFNDSTIAYQGIARGLGKDFVENQCHLACDGVLPFLTLLLDIEPKAGLERARSTTKQELTNEDRIESESIGFHEKVRSALLELSKKDPNRMYVIDASLNLDAVFDKAYSIVMNHLER